MGGLESDGTIPLNSNNEYVGLINLRFDDFNGLNLKESVPLMLLAENKGHSSAIEFSAKIIGQSGREPPVEVGEPMVLGRF